MQNSLFQKGMTSFEVSKAITRYHPQIVGVSLLSHTVDVNWRQKYLDGNKKMRKLLESFDHGRITNVYNLDKDAYLNLDLNKFTKDFSEHEVLSFCSKVKLKGDSFRHIAMMNFHPEENIDLTHIRRAIKYICGAREGVLLDSGRYYHYWGNFLLSEIELIRFLGEFLMPTVIVSPRYIGHQLFNGSCTLRLTSDSTYKPQVPAVIETIAGKGESSFNGNTINR